MSEGQDMKFVSPTEKGLLRDVGNGLLPHLNQRKNTSFILFQNYEQLCKGIGGLATFSKKNYAPPDTPPKRKSKSKQQ